MRRCCCHVVLLAYSVVVLCSIRTCTGLESSSSSASSGGRRRGSLPISALATTTRSSSSSLVETKGRRDNTTTRSLASAKQGGKNRKKRRTRKVKKKRRRRIISDERIDDAEEIRRKPTVQKQWPGVVPGGTVADTKKNRNNGVVEDEAVAASSPLSPKKKRKKKTKKRVKIVKTFQNDVVLPATATAVVMDTVTTIAKRPKQDRGDDDDDDDDEEDNDHVVMVRPTVVAKKTRKKIKKRKRKTFTSIIASPGFGINDDSAMQSQQVNGSDYRTVLDVEMKAEPKEVSGSSSDQVGTSQNISKTVDDGFLDSLKSEPRTEESGPLITDGLEESASILEIIDGQEAEIVASKDNRGSSVSSEVDRLPNPAVANDPPPTHSDNTILAAGPTGFDADVDELLSNSNMSVDAAMEDGIKCNVTTGSSIEGSNCENADGADDDDDDDDSDTGGFDDAKSKQIGSAAQTLELHSTATEKSDDSEMVGSSAAGADESAAVVVEKNTSDIEISETPLSGAQEVLRDRAYNGSDTPPSITENDHELSVVNPSAQQVAIHKKAAQNEVDGHPNECSLPDEPSGTAVSVAAGRVIGDPSGNTTSRGEDEEGTLPESDEGSRPGPTSIIPKDTTNGTIADGKQQGHSLSTNGRVDKTYVEPETVVSSVTKPRANATMSLRNLKILSSFDQKSQGRSELIVSAVTWNLAEASPLEDEARFIQRLCKGSDEQSLGSSDFVLIAGQECENIMPRRSEGHRSREFRRLVIQMLGKQYVPIALHMLGGIQFALFCKRKTINDVKFAAVADVTCGIGNVFHNKGAIGCYVMLNTKCVDAPPVRLLFIGAHMAAHVKNSDARDADFWRIMSELESQAPPWYMKPSGTESGDGARIQAITDFVLFCGDLNYRIGALPREEVEDAIAKFDCPDNDDAARQRLLSFDQLRASIAGEKAFPGFCEGEIKFRPTFKFDKGTSDYDSSKKQRIPAWTDRILYKSKHIVDVLQYDCANDAQHSDHRPVYGRFRLVMSSHPADQPPSGNATTAQRRKSRRKTSATNAKKNKQGKKPVATSRTI